MEYVHISNINFSENLNRRVFGIFLAMDVEVRVQQDNVTKYLNLTMVDRGIKINAKRFGATESEIQKLVSGKVYCAAIDVKPYKKDPNGLSCIIYNFDDCNEDPSQFIDWAEGMDKAYITVKETLGKLQNTVYGAIASNIVSSKWNQLRVWAAATSFHHNQLGGLLVHTAEVIRLSECIADYWEERYGNNFINRHLLLSASLLHDIAKIEEISVDATIGKIEYSTDATLGTHITMGISMIDKAAFKLNIGEPAESKSTDELAKEQEALKLLKHCILSHHKTKEFGSPIEPSIPEASIIHSADCLSAEMFRFNKAFNEIQPGTSQTVWTNKNMLCTYKDSTK